MTSDMEDRLAAAGQRWRAAQPDPPAVDPSRFAVASKQPWVRPTRWAPLAAAAAIVALVAGVGLVRTPHQDVVPSATGAPQDPFAMVGSWQVTSANSEPGTILSIGLGLQLSRACGFTSGNWLADTSGQFLADVQGWKQTCPVPNRDPTLAWLFAAVAFRVDGAARELLDAAGEPLARLIPGPAPTPDPYQSPDPQKLAEELRRKFADPAPLPRGLRPADRGALLGRWLAVAVSVPRPEQPYLEIRADNDWTASDGCNRMGGRWLTGPAGALSTTWRGQTLAGCSNVDVGRQMSQARRAGLDGDELVLFDAAGTELGRFRRP